MSTELPSVQFVDPGEQPSGKRLMAFWNEFSEFADEHQKALEQLVYDQNLATDRLTGQQLAQAIRQALASGDLQRCVTVDPAGQQVIYVPYQREQQLLSEIQCLTGLLERHGIKVDHPEQS